MNKLKELFDYYFNIICTILLVFLLSGVIYLIYTKVSKKEEYKAVPVEKSEKLVFEDKKIKVDIKGEVKKPSVYEVLSDSNVADLIKKAGGLTKNATTENINLSKKLEDQMVIKIFSKKELKKNSEISECVCKDVNIEKCIDSPIVKQEGQSIGVVNEATDDASSSKLISINTATKEQLMTLTSIGESKAQAIISYRENNGPFKTIENIKDVSGIGDALYEKIKDSITI